MKINMRFVIFGVILACVAALGFSRGAWAGPLMDGTVPSCYTTIYVTGHTCNASAIGSGFSLTDVPLPESKFPLVPGSLNFGPGVNFVSNGNLVTICFPDVDTPPVGNVWHWNTVSAEWVYWPTFHTAPGLTCTYTATDGIYTIEY